MLHTIQIVFNVKTTHYTSPFTKIIFKYFAIAFFQRFITLSYLALHLDFQHCFPFTCRGACREWFFFLGSWCFLCLQSVPSPLRRNSYLLYEALYSKMRVQNTQLLELATLSSSQLGMCCWSGKRKRLNSFIHYLWEQYSPGLSCKKTYCHLSVFPLSQEEPMLRGRFYFGHPAIHSPLTCLEEGKLVSSLDILVLADWYFPNNVKHRFFCYVSETKIHHWDDRSVTTEQDTHLILPEKEVDSWSFSDYEPCHVDASWMERGTMNVCFQWFNHYATWVRICFYYHEIVLKSWLEAHFLTW